MELDNVFAINANRARATGFSDNTFKLAHADTPLATDAHSVQAVGRDSNLTSSRIGVLWRKHATSSTRTCYIAALGGGNVLFWKLVTGSLTQITSATMTTASDTDYLIYAEHDGSDQVTIKVDGVTRIGPTTNTDITDNLVAGITARTQAASTHDFDDFTAADMTAGDASGENKRRSVLGHGIAPLTIPPVPDGEINAADRRHLTGFYRLDGAAPPTTHRRRGLMGVGR